MKKIFITATNTDIGKTYTTLKLYDKLQKKGISVCMLKPIETGVEETPLDASRFYELQKQNFLSINDVVFFTYKLAAAPYIASKKRYIDTQEIIKKIEKLQNDFEIILIEGAGGLYVPINKDYFMIDMIKEINPGLTLLVTHCKLGCINDTLLSKEALKNYGINHKVIFNCMQQYDEFEKLSKPFFDDIGFDMLEIDKDIEKIVQNIMKD